MQNGQEQDTSGGGGRELVPLPGGAGNPDNEDDGILEIPGWPGSFVPQTQPVQLNLASFTAGAVFIGFALRALVTYANTFEEILSIYDLVLILGAHIFGDSMLWPFLFTLLFSASGYVTWRFWTPAVQEYTAVGVDWAANRFRTPVMVFVPPANSFLNFINRRYLAPIFETRGWLGYVSVASSVALVGLVTNENAEGTSEFFGFSSRSYLILGFSLSLAVSALLFSIITDLHMIWQDRFAAEGRPITARRPGMGTYIIVTLGMLELAYRTYIVTYLTVLEVSDSRWTSFSIAFTSTLFSAIQNFCFQAIYALDGSPLIGVINRALLRMPMPAKVIFLISNGITVIVINLSLSTYNIQTLLVTNFGVPFRAAFIIGGVHSIFIATGDFITSFMDSVMRITMGWDLSPEMRFIQGDRSPAALNSLARVGRYRIAYAGAQERQPVPDNQAVELLALEGGNRNLGPNQGAGNPEAGLNNRGF